MLACIFLVAFALPYGGAPEDFARLIASKMKVWAPIVEKTGFQMN